MRISPFHRWPGNSWSECPFSVLAFVLTGLLAGCTHPLQPNLEPQGFSTSYLRQVTGLDHGDMAGLPARDLPTGPEMAIDEPPRR